MEAEGALKLEGDWLAEFIVGEEALEEPDKELALLLVPLVPVEPDGM